MTAFPALVKDVNPELSNCVIIIIIINIFIYVSEGLC